jgi:hypothetical protein
MAIINSRNKPAMGNLPLKRPRVTSAKLREAAARVRGLDIPLLIPDLLMKLLKIPAARSLPVSGFSSAPAGGSRLHRGTTVCAMKRNRLCYGY